MSASSAPLVSAWTGTAEPLPQTRPLEADRRADVAIVGAGYTGLSAALHLAERGADVVVLDAAEPGWGASGRNGGQVIPGLKHEPDELEHQFGRETGRRMWEIAGGAADVVFDLIGRLKISCHAERCGWIAAAPHAAALESLRSRTEQWQRRGAPVELLDGTRIAELTGTTGVRRRDARPSRRGAPAAGLRARAGPGGPAGRRRHPRGLPRARARDGARRLAGGHARREPDRPIRHPRHQRLLRRSLAGAQAHGAAGAELPGRHAPAARGRAAPGASRWPGGLGPSPDPVLFPPRSGGPPPHGRAGPPRRPRRSRPVRAAGGGRRDGSFPRSAPARGSTAGAGGSRSPPITCRICTSRSLAC